MKRMNAPVSLFVYNRPEHTKITLDALAENDIAKETELFIFSDGPKENAAIGELNKIKRVREFIKGENRFKNVHVLESEKNKGLYSSLVSGVTETVNTYGRIIVLEDDIQVSKYFLSFMNHCLDVYADTSNIFSVCGFMYPLNYPEKKTVLLPLTSTWGWATWKEKWECFDKEINQSEFLNSQSEVSKKFNIGNVDYCKMLATEKNSWGIKWYYSVFKKHGLNVFPTTSLVKNIGFDGTGTHDSIYINQKYFEEVEIPVTLDSEIDLKFYSTFLDHLARNENNKFGWLKRLIKKISNA